MYRYNGKELDEATQLYDYGARYYDPAVARWGQVDPLAEQRVWISPYNYVQNNPVSRIDPNGALDSPIFGEDGSFLGIDSEGYTGEIIVMSAHNYNLLTGGDSDVVLEHDLVMDLVDKVGGSYGTKLNDGSLSAEGYSKVYTHVMNQLKGINFDRLEGGKINVVDFPVDEDGNMGFEYGESFGDYLRLPVSAEAGTSTNEDGSIDVTTALLGGKGQFNTVEHAQSTLGIHEYYGHGLKQVPQAYPGHSRAYQYEKNHKSTYNKLTGNQKARIESGINQ